MTCDDYLAMLETLPVEELMYGGARDHAAGCHDCNRVTRVVAERERNMVLALDDMSPSIAPGSVAREALEIARRRRIVSYLRASLGVMAAAAVVLVVASRRLIPAAVIWPPAPQPAPLPVPRVSETILLKCLMPEAAAITLQRDAPQRSVAFFPSATVPSIMVETTHDDMGAVHSIIDEQEKLAAPDCPARKRF